jgi:sec-independent protein translocase protein TatC
VSVSERDREEIDKSSAPLIEHLVELRRRLIWSLGGFFVAFLVCFFFAKRLFNILVVPFKWATQWANLDPSKVELIYTAPQEFFFTQVKLAMFGGMVIAFPLIATQIYKFIAPGLYKNERMALVPFLIATPIMFAVGATFLYFVLLPLALHFFVSYQQYANIELMPKIGEYIDLVMKLVFAFGLCFEMPVILTLLAKVGIVSSQALREKRRYAIIVVVVVAAIFTPPDAISMCSLAVPMIGLYEISIWLARSVEKKRAAADAAAAAESGGEITPAS